MDVLEEFLVYQAMSESDILVHIWQESKVKEQLNVGSDETVTHHCMDMTWEHLQDKLPHLTEVTLSVLTLPCSHPAEEGVFFFY